ncbi:right-handed parallel beta-helix repeat-containing protein [Deinococcus metallilatus]|nr:right-handed parallel beta-helix repeat-containing protein [Deinococcus metallilatus]MBB5296811.1 parallel beta-helix repeat protein [Deinococcus metallilatus]GMA13843.1 hypothetical protein GCM10025871_01740 [Deinococcus metallilatus]
MPYSDESRAPRSRPLRVRPAAVLLGMVTCSAVLALAAKTASNPTVLQFEADRARGQDDQSLPAAANDAGVWIVSDRAATDGRAVMLAVNGATVRQVLPASFKPGTYTVQIRARGQAYQGWPTVELRLDGKRVAAATLQSRAYATQTFAKVELRPGQRLEVVFVNDAYDGSPDKDRNAVVDRFDLKLLAAAKPPVRSASVASAAAAPQTPAGNVLNVKTAGAKGDGTTDDTAALARIGNAGGKDIYFPPGTYLVRRPVRFDGLKNQTVSGSGATIRASDDFKAGDALGVLTFTNTQGLTVRDLTIIGNPNHQLAPFDQRADGLYVSDSRGVHIQGLNVQNAHTVGITADDSDDVTIEANTVSQAYDTGIGTGNSNNVKILRNTVIGFGDPSGLKSKVPPGLGIFGWGGNTWLAEGNVLKNISNTATKTEGVDNTTYRGNTVDAFGKDGIKIMPRPGYGTSVSHAVVENNVIRNRHPWVADGTSYILFHSVLGGRIAGNKIESTYRPGTFYEEDAIRVNTFTGGPPSRDIVIEGNEIDNTRRGVRLEADGTIFRGNTVRGTEPWARSGLIVSSNGVTVSKNTFDGPVIAVLLDTNAARTRLEENRFSNNSTSGIYADNHNPDTTIVGNEFGVNVPQPIAGKVIVCEANKGGGCQ